MGSRNGSSLDGRRDRGFATGSPGARRYFRTVFLEMSNLLAIARIDRCCPDSSTTCFTVDPPSTRRHLPGEIPQKSRWAGGWVKSKSALVGQFTAGDDTSPVLGDARTMAAASAAH